MVKPEAKDEIVVTLSKKLSVHKAGEVLYSNKITLKAPCAKNISKSCILKQIVFSAFKNNTSNASAALPVDNKKSDMQLSDSEQMITVLYMGASSDGMLRIMEEFRKLLLADCGLIEDVVVTDVLLDQLSVLDVENMLGEYILNFMLPSGMRELLRA